MTPAVQEGEHMADVAAAIPAVRSVPLRRRTVLELPREHGAVALKLPENVALERLVCLQELVAPALALVPVLRALAGDRIVGRAEPLRPQDADARAARRLGRHV